MSKHFRRRTVVALAASTLLLTGAALAQNVYPNKPIKLIVPYSAGGLPDTVARIVAARLSDSLGSVVVENRPGANGGVAASAVKNAPADGYTFLVTDGSMMTINPILNARLTYSPKEFLPVSLIASSPLFLVVNPKVEAKTLDEFVKLAKARPGRLNYGSSGVGSTHHLTGEALKAGFGIFMTHIPFRGSANSVPALIGGEVDMVFSAYPSMAGFVKSGQARILATNSAKRSSLAPDVPAISERLPGFDFAVLVGMFAAQGTPPDIIQRVSAEIARVVKNNDVIDRMKTAGIEPVGSGPSELATALQKESTRVAAAAKSANLKPE